MRVERKVMERIIFAFNKAHNADKSIPPWIIKHRGQTHNIHHLDSALGFSTKETPDNDHTKGSIQFRGNLEIIEKDGQKIAKIT